MKNGLNPDRSISGTMFDITTSRVERFPTDNLRTGGKPMLDTLVNMRFWDWMLEPIPNLILLLLTLLVTVVMITRRTLPAWPLASDKL
jgi:hypothetical protein